MVYDASFFPQALRGILLHITVFLDTTKYVIKGPACQKTDANQKGGMVSFDGQILQLLYVTHFLVLILIMMMMPLFDYLPSRTIMT